MNGKIKSVCSRFATLNTFTEFSAVMRVLRGERTHGHIMQRIRTPGTPDVALTADDKTYSELTATSCSAAGLRGHPTLDTFFTEFSAVMRVLRGERTHCHIMQRSRTSGTPNVGHLLHRVLCGDACVER